MRLFLFSMTFVCLFVGVTISATTQTDAVLFADFREMTITIIPPKSYNEWTYYIHIEARIAPEIVITEELADRLRLAMARTLMTDEFWFTALIITGGTRLQFTWDAEAQGWIVIYPERGPEPELTPETIAMFNHPDGEL